MNVRACAAYGVALFTLGVSIGGTPQTSPSPSGLYAPNPAHLWNRVHNQLHVRTAPDGSRWGSDALDPYLWRETRYLLTGPSHASALRVLDECLASRGERLVHDPLKRAIFQQDLWAVFDWAVESTEGTDAARLALQRRLAQVMRRVALTLKEIDALPDNYRAAAGAGLPRDLFDPSGPWVNVGGTQPVAAHHSGELSRSAFTVLWSVPGGASATSAYLQKLWTFPQPFAADSSFTMSRDGELRTKLNPSLPPVPDGTRIALVRTMLLVDDKGNVVPSRIVQSVQLRAFPGSAFTEFRLNRVALFAGRSGGLAAVAPDQQAFITFSPKGMDPFEQKPWRGSSSVPRVLQSCESCHNADVEPPVATVRSLGVMLRQASFADTRHERWARWFTQAVVAAEAKSRRYDWGVLRTQWQSAR